MVNIKLKFDNGEIIVSNKKNRKNVDLRNLSFGMRNRIMQTLARRRQEMKIIN